MHCQYAKQSPKKIVRMWVNSWDCAGLVGVFALHSHPDRGVFAGLAAGFEVGDEEEEVVDGDGAVRNGVDAAVVEVGE